MDEGRSVFLDTLRLTRESRARRTEAAECRLYFSLDRLGRMHANATLEAVLDCALDAALSVGASSMCIIELINRRSGALEVKAHRGLDQAFLDGFRFTSAAGRSRGAILKRAAPIVIQDVNETVVLSDEQGEAIAALKDAGVRALHWTPMVDSSGKVIGALSLHYNRPRNFDLDCVERMCQVVAAIARLIESRHLGRDAGPQ